MTVKFKNWQENLQHLIDSVNESFDDVVAPVETTKEQTVSESKVEQSQLKTYSEFMTEMSKACGKKTGKVIIHDGDEDGKKVTEAKDDDDYGWNHKEKETPKPTSRKIAGRAYGGAAQKDDDDEETPKAAEKRGRGRPKGSTSGARTQGAARKSYGGLAIHSLSLPNRNK